MSRQEREEIKDLPEKYKPMGAWDTGRGALFIVSLS